MRLGCPYARFSASTLPKKVVVSEFGVLGVQLREAVRTASQKDRASIA